MSAPDQRLTIVDRDGERRLVCLDDYLDAQAIENAEREANAWIKRLRHVAIDGVALRDRLHFRDDSLWWFVELYLHKQRTIVSVYRAIFALEALIAREQPRELEAGDNRLLQILAKQAGSRHRFRVAASRGTVARWRSHARLFGLARFHTLSAVADRLRPRSRRQPLDGSVDVAAFVHTAFWRADQAEEGYIGPVLRALEERLPNGRLALVGLGPRTNFRMRRWRHRFAEFNDPHARSLPFAPIEMLAGPAAIRPSMVVWRSRRRTFRLLAGSAEMRRAAVIEGYDAWPIVAAELRGVTDLQLPWSARCMDEAAAALDALRPSVVLTYAEAGGWGRALVLEARRRKIPVVGLQHGFIYRHWLNYLHERDEMEPSTGSRSDAGFPRPDLTLLYDGFAWQHLVEAGSFPPGSVAVTGSPRLEAFVEAGRRLTTSDRQRVRAAAGARPEQRLVVLATKFTQIGPWFRALVDAVAEMPDLQLAVKCHPAEAPGPYEQVAAGTVNVRVLGARTDLAELVACADLIVTVNSTAALEAMALEVPGLVLALPNNLSPFVQAGALAGVSDPAEVAAALARLMYDRRERQILTEGRQAFINRYGMVSEGGAAARAAEAILRLAAGRPVRP